MIRRFAVIAFALLTLGSAALAAEWPDGPWINGTPRESASLSVVAFVSPADLQFFKLMQVWKKLEKKYSALNVDFLIVAMQEPLLPFSESQIQNEIRENGYGLPVLVDSGSRYSKLWRVYVSPTVNLVSRGGKVTGLDPGNFDGFVFEKTLQKLLRENGTTALPGREYPAETDTKSCGHAHTMLVGQKFQKAWESNSPSLDGSWSLEPMWISKDTTQPAQLEISVNRASTGLIASSQAASSKLNVLLDGQKIPAELRGKDIQEEKSGSATFVNVRSARVYEILSHSGRLKDGSSKLTFTTDAKGLRVWGLQTLPHCLDPIQ